MGYYYYYKKEKNIDKNSKTIEENKNSENKQEESTNEILKKIINNSNEDKEKLINAINLITNKVNEINTNTNEQLQKALIESNKLKLEFDNICKENQELKNKIEKLNEQTENSKCTIEYKNIKALKIHQNIFEYNTYVENLYNISSWEIRADSYEKRAEILSNYPYWEELKNEFNNKKLTDRYLNNNQLVSYFDTMYLMYQLLNDITNENIKKEMKIIQEYRIDAPNKPRIDYLLTFRNDLILLEFGKSNPKDLGKDLTEKQRQLEGYEKTLKNSLEDKEKYILTSIPIVYLSEESQINKEHNNEALRSALKQINKALKNQKDAFEQLQNIE